MIGPQEPLGALEAEVWKNFAAALDDPAWTPETLGAVMVALAATGRHPAFAAEAARRAWAADLDGASIDEARAAAALAATSATFYTAQAALLGKPERSGLRTGALVPKLLGAETHAAIALACAAYHGCTPCMRRHAPDLPPALREAAVRLASVTKGLLVWLDGAQL